MKLVVSGVDFFISEARTRLPFRFGAVTMERAATIVARARIESEAGPLGEGFSSDLLVPKWFDKNPDTSIEEDRDALIASSRAAGVLSIPNIGLYYGVHNWTAQMTNGIVDARFIAVMDTAIESPLGQVAMIPMLAWIARNAPDHLKATFFAVMASFTNLALSASSLATKYVNQILPVTREVKDSVTGKVLVAADYSLLGWLLILVAAIAVIAPLVTIVLVQRSRLKTNE